MIGNHDVFGGIEGLVHRVGARLLLQDPVLEAVLNEEVNIDPHSYRGWPFQHCCRRNCSRKAESSRKPVTNDYHHLEHLWVVSKSATVPTDGTNIQVQKSFQHSSSHSWQQRATVTGRGWSIFAFVRSRPVFGSSRYLYSGDCRLHCRFSA